MELIERRDYTYLLHDNRVSGASGAAWHACSRDTRNGERECVFFPHLCLRLVQFLVTFATDR